MKILNLGSAGNLETYLRTVRQIRSDWAAPDLSERRADAQVCWFRGQSHWEWGLSPRLYRPEFDGADEAEIRLEFHNQAVQLVTGRAPDSDWGWYFLMQHYGVPTRLLDWTENPLVGLYFALLTQNPDCDAAVWVLDPCWLNGKNRYPKRKGAEGALLPDWEEASAYLPGLEDAFRGARIKVADPAAIEPPHIDRRIVAQASRFVVFGNEEDLAESFSSRGSPRLGWMSGIRRLSSCQTWKG